MLKAFVASHLLSESAVKSEGGAVSEQNTFLDAKKAVRHGYSRLFRE